MDDGIGRPVELLDGKSTRAVRPQDRDHALVMRCDRDGLGAVAVDVSDLGVSHAAELSSEIHVPERVQAAIGAP